MLFTTFSAVCTSRVHRTRTDASSKDRREDAGSVRSLLGQKKNTSHVSNPELVQYVVLNALYRPACSTGQFCASIFDHLKLTRNVQFCCILRPAARPTACCCRTSSRADPLSFATCYSGIMEHVAVVAPLADDVCGWDECDVLLVPAVRTGQSTSHYSRACQSLS